MKQITGQPYNITTDILGRITTSGKNVFSRTDCILVQKDVTSVPMEYSAVITNTQSLKSSKPYIICEIERLDEFEEGDVVLVNTMGEIVFLYEYKSCHNAIFVTGKCNHRCIMCPQPPVAQEKDKTSFNLKLISLIDKKTLNIGITGGEPTLIGDKLFNIIRQIVKCQPKASISLLSNGVKFADKDYAMKLAICGYHDLQVDVPIFSDIAEIHNRIVGANTFYKTVQGLYNLALFHIRVGLRIVVHRQTYKRLPQLADYIYHNFPFVSQVAFLQMETIGLAEKNLEELWIDPYDYNEELMQAVLLLENRGICAKIYNAQLCVLPKEIQKFACNSISDWKDVYLNECDGCKLKENCGGFFASNKSHHSKHIKPELKYTPMPNPINGIQTISKFVEQHLTDDVLSNYSNPIILDVPCGYGRHLQWLAERGYTVIGIDLDVEALEYLNKWKTKTNNSKVIIKRMDIEEMNGSLQCDILLNVHLYSPKIFKNILTLVRPGGLFIMETPENHENNYVDLPLKGEIKHQLEQEFDIYEYIELEKNDVQSHVAVKVIAKRK